MNAPSTAPDPGLELNMPPSEEYRLFKKNQGHPRELHVAYATPRTKGKTQVQTTRFIVRYLMDFSMEKRFATFYDQRGELVSVQWGVNDCVVLMTTPHATPVSYEVEP